MLRAVLHKTSTLPTLVNERVQCNAAGQVVLNRKTSWSHGTTHQVMLVS